MGFQVGDRVLVEAESTERPARVGTVRELLGEDPTKRYRIVGSAATRAPTPRRRVVGPEADRCSLPSARPSL
jgi:hypothetical protein